MVEVKGRGIVAAAGSLGCSRAWATGSEMAGWKLVVPILAAIGVVALVALFLAIRSRLPSHWTTARRSFVAAVAAPGGLVLLLAIYSAYSYARFRWLR